MVVRITHNFEIYPIMRYNLIKYHKDGGRKYSISGIKVKSHDVERCKLNAIDGSLVMVQFPDNLMDIQSGAREGS